MHTQSIDTDNVAASLAFTRHVRWSAVLGILGVRLDPRAHDLALVS